MARRVGSGQFVNRAGPVQDAMSDVTHLIAPLQVIETWFAIEPCIARLAALHASARDLETIENVLLQLEAAGSDPDHLTKFDSEFHLQLARASRSSLVLRLCQEINTVRTHAQWEQMKPSILSPEEIASYNVQHRGIFDSLRQRDAQSASELITRHLATARQDLVGADSI